MLVARKEAEKEELEKENARLKADLKYRFLGWYEVYCDGDLIAVCKYEADSDGIKDSYSPEDVCIEVKIRNET